MSLPLNSTPIYTLKVPSTKKTLKYRPFLVKDEKALLIAQQSEDQSVMLDTIKSVIASCAKSDINVDTLASFDVEFIFTQLRAVSVGEVVELIFKCDDCSENNEKARATVFVNLNDMKVEIPEGHSLKIPLFDDVGVMMKYPTINTLKKIGSSISDDFDQQFELIIDCIDYIYNSDEVFTAAEQTPEELKEFLDNLTSTQLDNMKRFFRTMPTLRYNFKYKCPECGKDHNKYLEGLSSFF